MPYEVKRLTTQTKSYIGTGNLSGEYDTLHFICNFRFSLNKTKET